MQNAVLVKKIKMDDHATRQPQPPASPAEGDAGRKRQRTAPVEPEVAPPKKSPPRIHITDIMISMLSSNAIIEAYLHDGFR